MSTRINQQSQQVERPLRKLPRQRDPILEGQNDDAVILPTY
jgi:hypothetical protein